MPTKKPGMLIHPDETVRQRIDDVCRAMGISRTQLINQLFSNDQSLASSAFLQISKNRIDQRKLAEKNIESM